MKKVYKLSVLAGALALTSSMAMADLTYQEGGHPYVSGAIGWGQILVPSTTDLVNQSPVPGSSASTDKGGFAYAVSGGYLYHINQFAFGGEVGYNGYNTSQTHLTIPGLGTINNKYDVSAIDFLAVGRFYMNPAFSVALKAGGLYTMQKIDSNAFASVKTDRVLPALGGGVGFNITENMMLTADALYGFGTVNPDFNSDYKPNQNQPVISALAGLTYSF